MSRPRVRFDWWEVVLLVGAFALGGAVWAAHNTATNLRSPHWNLELLAPYGAKYKDRETHGGEEWLIRDFFDDRRNGVFVDVGAYHYRSGSTTYTLETKLGWSGVAIDAQARFGPDFAKYRPRTRFINAFVSDVSGAVATLYVPKDEPALASSDPASPEGAGYPRGDSMDVRTATLNDLLDAAGIQAIDFLSMDIELAEPKALAGFDIRRFAPALVCIEAHSPVRQQILNYFAEHDYVLVGRYWNIDLFNMYFMPLDSARRVRLDQR